MTNTPPLFKRACALALERRLQESNGKIQIITGPRQTGKSTAIRQALTELREKSIAIHYAEVPADVKTGDWIRAQWNQARYLTQNGSHPAVLAIDEVQLIDQWSAYVRELRDQDIMAGVDLRVVLSGSSALLLSRGLGEALTGRYEIIRSPQWSLRECREAFGYTLDDYLCYGGYPGAALYRDDEGRWLDYMVDAVLEPSVAKDVIALEPIRKPSLMRRLFYLATACSGQVVSYRKLLGQLADAGNATTIAHYLDLLDNAGLLTGLQCYAAGMVRKSASSPKLVSRDPGLMQAAWRNATGIGPMAADRRGRVVETAVGAELVRRAQAEHFGLSWWRERDLEVDFVCERAGELLAIEVKSGRVKSVGGLEAFINRHPGARGLVVGPPGAGWQGSSFCELESFLAGDVTLFA